MAISDEPPLGPPPDGTSGEELCTVFFGHTNFLARSLVSAIIHSGSYAVRVAETAGMDPADQIPAAGASSVLFDSSNPSDIEAAVAGSSVVFLFDPTLGSPLVDASSDPLRFYNLTVLSAKHVSAACRSAGVRRLVYTGSADVVFDGKSDVVRGDESMAYPETFAGLLDEFRAQAERIVLGNDGKDGVSVCVLRVSNPFGPGDGFLVPFLVRGAISGWAKFIIGSGQNMCDFTYVENIAHANICADRALKLDKTSVAGKPFFITNHDPVYLWEFISNILEGLGYKRPVFPLPAKFVLLGSLLVGWICDKSGLGNNWNPDLSSAIIRMLSCTRTFGHAKTQKFIGYSPIVSLEVAVRSTVDSFSELAAKNQIRSGVGDFSSPSKADRLLGSGKVADILLWRDEKRSFSCAMALFFLYYWFILSGRTFVSSFAKLLLVATFILLGHGFLPSSVFGDTFEKMSSCKFEVSESAMRHLFVTGALIWNRGVFILKSLAQGDDFYVFLKAAGYAYVVTWLLSFSFSVLVGTGLICLFTVFIMYEQYEQEVEKVLTLSDAGIRKLVAILISKLPSPYVMYVHKD